MRRAVAGVALALALFAAPSDGAITCRSTAGPPGSETTVEVTIVSPEDGATLDDCTSSAVITGTWSVSGPPANYDFYIVIDSSGSTTNDSGADVDGNGVFAEAADNIYHAELAAARAFVDAVQPDHSRVAILAFSDAATLQQELTADLDAVRATLDGMSLGNPSGGTAYVPAMALVEAEVAARGDRVTRHQRCVFLSDGEPNESLQETDAAAQQLAALGVIMDTFALGAIDSDALESMASITLGRFTTLTTPGDIVAQLPHFATDTPDTFVASNMRTGSVEPVTFAEDGTFSVTVTLDPAAGNVIRITLTAGLPDVASVECGITLSGLESVTPDAGDDIVACWGASILLDASRTTSTCTRTWYRWRNCRGQQVCPDSEDPTCTVTADDCETYVLEAWCEASACSATDDVGVAPSPGPPQPRVSWVCGDRAVVSFDWPASSEYGWDLDPSVDSDGDGNPSEDRDVLGREHEFVDTGVGAVPVAAWVRYGSCVVTAALSVDFTLPNPAPVAWSSRGCSDQVQFFLECPVGATSCGWDLDALVDADADGDPSNDWDLLDTQAYLNAAGAEHLVVVALATDGTCTSSTTLGMDFPLPWSLDGASCSGLAIQLSCAEPPASRCYWDLDATVDSEGDGDPTNDQDAVGCYARISPPDGPHEIRLWCVPENGWCYGLNARGTITVGAGLAPGEVSGYRVVREASGSMRHSWTPTPGADEGRLLRGTLASLWTALAYDHVADDAIGAGACSVAGAATSDDDASLPGDFYYLVTALSPCGGGESPTGSGWTGSSTFPRPPRIPSASCP